MTLKTYEYEERAFLTEDDFLKIKAKLDKMAIKITPDNKTSYFFVLPDKNVSIAVSHNKTVFKYKGGQLNNGGNGFEEHEISIDPRSLSEALELFSLLFGLEPEISEQFRVNYVLPNSIEVALKYTQMWGFHLEVEKLYSVDTANDDVSEKEKAKNDVDTVGKMLGVKYISDEVMKDFVEDIKAKKTKGQYSPDEFRKKYGQLFTDKKLDIELAKQAQGYLMDLGSLCTRFVNVNRALVYKDGRFENDSEHSFHLALSAAELAATYFPELNAGLISQFSLVHDMPEVYVGDTWTFNISKEDRDKKESAEKVALKRLLTELPPHTAQLLSRYEKQQEPEARFVRMVDKIMPGIIAVLGDIDTCKSRLGIKDIDDFSIANDANLARLQTMFPEFPFLHLVRELCSKALQKEMFK